MKQMKILILAAGALLFMSGSLKDTGGPFFCRFDRELDPSLWIVADNTFEGSASAFIPEGVSLVDGRLRLTIQPLAEPRHGRQYGGATVQSVRYFGYGTFTVRMRAPIASGTTGTFFLMNRWTGGDWFHKEIDVELLGKSRHAVQFNIHRFSSQSGSAVGQPFLYEAPFDYDDGFHDYSIRWMKDRVEFRVDGQLVHSYTENIPDEPLSIMLNHWVADPESSWAGNWLGPFNPGDLPSWVEYEWVRFDPE
jgi:beta-glucanase (GH16 family)